MLKINIGTSFDPEEIVVDENITLEEAFRKVNVQITQSTIVTVNARRVTNLSKTLADLGVNDGDIITANEKQDGARG